MAERHFTREEATALLEEVRPVAEALVAHRRALTVAAARRARITARISGNGGDFDPQEPRELDEQLEREAEAVKRAVEQLQRLGVLVKDLDRGLVDFPTLRDGEEVLLCWRVGEEEIAHWHGVDEGFAGRKPLDFD
ncbi:MAG TPA: DUF2203 domain-containing protein [Gaiellaceae bacterium]|jgi:hypothetical protein|nr:DUF2203 domain-containing protein [Gaiellaceae bacterium]